MIDRHGDNICSSLVCLHAEPSLESMVNCPSSLHHLLAPLCSSESYRGGGLRGDRSLGFPRITSQTQHCRKQQLWRPRPRGPGKRTGSVSLLAASLCCRHSSMGWTLVSSEAYRPCADSSRYVEDPLDPFLSSSLATFLTFRSI